MSRLAAALCAVLFCGSSLVGASFSIHDYLDRRFHPLTVEVKPVEGLAERTVDGKLHLHLREFLELVLRNSTDVRLTRLDLYTAADQITAAKAPLDPLLTGGFTTLRSISPAFTQITGAQTLSSLNQTSTLNYQELLPTGQTVTAGFQAIRSSTNSAFDFYNPYLLGNLSITVAQPLLRDRNRIEFTGPIQIARSELQVTAEVSEAHIADVVATAAGQYWDAVRARDDIKVEQQNLELAQKSYIRDKQALDLGALAKLDIYQSETQVAERNRDLISAQYAYKTALDGLRRLIGADLTQELRKTELVLEDDPSALPPGSILPFEEALAKAKNMRPELSAAHRRVTVDDLNARIARNLLLPRLDLTAQGGATGLGGDLVPVTGLLGGVTLPGSSTGFGDTLRQTLGFTNPSYGGGLQFSIPFRNSAATAQLSDSLVNRTRDRYTERQVEQQITLDVRQAITSIDLANASIEAAKRARDLAVHNVEAEQQKYELGSITAFELLDAQTRLASAESALLNSYVGYQQAYVSYERSTWTLLDGLGMVVETPAVK